MTTDLIAEEPPKSTGKYDDLFRGACREPRTFFRLPEPFKSYASATYFRQTYADKFPGFRLEFKSTRIASGVYIYVAAFPTEDT